jgi:uncharacterized membrane protein
MKKEVIVKVLDKVLLFSFAVSWGMWILYPLAVWGVVAAFATISTFYFLHWKRKYWIEKQEEISRT